MSTGGGTTLRVDRLASTKSRAALALAVSLWIATGGVASAEETTVTVGSGETVQYVYNGEKSAKNPWATPRPTGEKTDYHTVINGGTATGRVLGGFSNDSNANNNTVTVTNVTITADVVDGGYSGSGGTGNANNNIVTLTDTIVDRGDTYGSNVTGGSSYAGDATGNSVTLIRSTVSNDVIGGSVNDYHTATGNTVSLTDSKVWGYVYGGFGGTGNILTGNTLNLSGENTVGGEVHNFETINITGATWGTPALTLNGANGITQNADNSWATINTDGVAFSGVDALSAGQNTVLIKNKMANYQGTITSGKYKIGTTLEGEGTASVSGNDLIYTIDTGAGATARDQTHNTVMGAAVGMAALSTGNDFILSATEGLALTSNVGADGIASFAKMGGAALRQETGSHIDVRTWNAILALGRQNKKERGTMEYGAFFEYGTGNYTTHAENDLRGDGSARYTGGGLLAKYTMKNHVYVEGSLRAGSVHDDARDVLRDADGAPYSYETDAPYLGFHLGVGKEIPLKNGDAVDVYGKYFYNRRNSVDFNAGGQYDLDAVTSQILRVGARYMMKREKWKFYGGVAYEHELDGKANGTADGVAIRGADTSGASLRAEIGATMTPDENSPWKLDLNLAGFAGKKEGVTGGVSVAWMF